MPPMNLLPKTRARFWPQFEHLDPDLSGLSGFARSDLF